MIVTETSKLNNSEDGKEDEKASLHNNGSSNSATFNYFTDVPQPSIPATKHSTDTTSSITTVESPVLHMDPLSVETINLGFAAIFRFLKTLPAKPRNNLSMSLIGTESLESIAVNGGLMSQRLRTVNQKPTYCYKNYPAEGWVRYISVNIVPDIVMDNSKLSKNRPLYGQTEVYYQPPHFTGVRIRSNRDLQQYITNHLVPPKIRRFIDFSSVFCLCHTPEDLDRNYIECSYGMTGCFGWVHPECVGLGPMSREQITEMKAVICPSCVAFLRITRRLDRFNNKEVIFLQKVTSPSEDCSYRDSVAMVNSFCISESSTPHESWGYQPSLYERWQQKEREEEELAKVRALQEELQEALLTDGNIIPDDSILLLGQESQSSNGTFNYWKDNDRDSKN